MRALVFFENLRIHSNSVYFHFSRHKIIEERKEYLEKLNIHRENEEKRKAAEALAEQQKLEEVQYYFPSKHNGTLQIYFSQELH